MYICICKAKTEDDIKREGVDTLAGTGCGTCLPYVHELLADQQELLKEVDNVVKDCPPEPL